MRKCKIKKDRNNIKVGDIVFTFYKWKFRNDEIIVPFEVKEFIDGETVYLVYKEDEPHDVIVRSIDDILTLEELNEKIKDFNRRFNRN